MPLSPIDKRIERRLADLETLATQLLEDNQSIRERIVSLEAEVRELQAHIRRQDRRDGGDRVN